ncbi:hypothetical protein ACIPSA_25640 [Streptomyces sp. NPDC086549]|uniref:hypothetical protein n=1 Tax=Streptomyces sp. NPDC086549 TaxID=3365752 RepID=UPI0037FAC7AB
MTGPLARLVGRSRSPVPGLRPRPASRYERPAAADGPPLPALHDAPESPVPHAAAPEPIPADVAGAPADGAGPQEPRPTEPADTEAGVPGREPPTRALSVVRHPPGARQDGLVRREGPVPQPHPAPVEATPEPGRPSDPRRGFLRDPAEAAPASPGRRGPQAGVGFDRPLLHAEVPPPELVADTPASAAPGEAEPAVVVEVSIGRLDVRTPPVPAPPQPVRLQRGAQADHAKALENYLRRRAEGELG